MAKDVLINDLEVACVHGRFQPFHLGHLEYVLRAYDASKFLYIGLANPDPTAIEPDSSSAHRHTTDANPFPYFVRMEMVIGSIKEAGVDVEKVRIIPFPINRPEFLKYYVPSEAVHIVTVYDAWGEKKVETLNQLGLTTFAVKGQVPKVTSGTEIRHLLHSGRSVTHLVPAFVAKYLENNVNRYLERQG